MLTYSGGVVPTMAAPPQARAASRGVAHVRPNAGFGAGGSRSVSAASNAQLELLQAQLAETTTMAEGFEKERDFYFESERHSTLFKYSKQS